jgi:hypothetical protein
MLRTAAALNHIHFLNPFFMKVKPAAETDCVSYNVVCDYKEEGKESKCVVLLKKDHHLYQVAGHDCRPESHHRGRN